MRNNLPGAILFPLLSRCPNTPPTGDSFFLKGIDILPQCVVKYFFFPLVIGKNPVNSHPEIVLPL
jgi:hypothetical protein